jgi:diguanylate cyclase (GGDEF)-like protein
MTDTLDPKELEKVTLLEGVDIESIQHLFAPCSVRQLKLNEVLIESGKPNRLMYALLSGRLRIHLDLEAEPITILEPGEIVGELSVIDGQATSAHVVSDGNCRVLGIDEKTAWALMHTSHNIAFNLIKVLAHRLRGGNSVISTTQKLQRKFERYAVIDALTGLYNRRWLDNTLSDQLEHCQETHRDFSVLILDLDGFKDYNDTYGHLAGDHVLCTVGQTLAEGMRAGEMIARYGGDEFIILMPDITIDLVEGVVERLRELVRQAPFGPDWSDLPSISLSIGWSHMTEDDTANTLVARADEALYQDKELRRQNNK